MTTTFDYSQYCASSAVRPPWLYPCTLFLQVGGSQAYGLATETSDTDYRGIAIPYLDIYLNPFVKFEQHETHTPCDLVVYEIGKFFRLAAQCNPNIIEMLYADMASYVKRPEKHERHEYAAFSNLLENRYLFLSKRAVKSFSGYALGQIRRIKSHRKWLLDPPTAPPRRSDYGLPDESKMPPEILGAVAASDEKLFSGEIMTLYAAEKQYLNAKTQWEQYQNWKKTRNPKRSALEAQYGYDCKHAMHTVRLLRMAEELFRYGVINVKRPDREELLAIRNGAWSYERMMAWAEATDAKIIELAQASSLPDHPDEEALGHLCEDIIHEFNYGSL